MINLVGRDGLAILDFYWSGCIHTINPTVDENLSNETSRNGG
jgi:hypothetical protein